MFREMLGVNLLSNHGLALVCVARDRGSRLRDIAECIGVTERATQRIVDDLVQAGYLERIREGNRNRYQVQPDVPMSHPLVKEHWVGELLAVLATESRAEPPRDLPAATEHPATV